MSLSPADLALFSFRKKVHIKGANYMVGLMKAALEAKSHKSALCLEVDGDRWTIKDHIRIEVSLRVPRFEEV
ncbi:hypothetical protein GCM10028818_00200 [Spirosoma horti]